MLFLSISGQWHAEQLFFEAIASGKIRVGGLLDMQLGTSLIVHFKYHINVYNLLKYQLSTKNPMVVGWVVKLYSLPQF